MEAAHSSVWQDVVLGASSVSPLPGLSEDHAREVQRLVVDGKHNGVRAKRNRFGKTVVAVPVVLPPPLPAAITGATATFFLDPAFPRSGVAGLGVHIDVVGDSPKDTLHSLSASATADRALTSFGVQCALLRNDLPIHFSRVVEDVLAKVLQSLSPQRAVAAPAKPQKWFGGITIGHRCNVRSTEPSRFPRGLPRELVSLIVSFLPLRFLLHFAHTCWLAYAIVETCCETQWEAANRCLWCKGCAAAEVIKSCCVVSSPRELWSLPVQRCPKTCAWSWRWSHAMLSTSTDHWKVSPGAKAELANSSLSINCLATNIALRRKQDPLIDEKIEMGSWLCLYFHSTNPVVRKWAHIQANAVAGQGNVALKLLATFPFDSVGPKMAAALAIPTSEFDQQEVRRRMFMKTLGMWPHEEHDVVDSGKRLVAIVH